MASRVMGGRVTLRPRIADHGGHIADEEDDGVAQVLEMFILRRMTVWPGGGRSGGIEAHFDAQRPPLLAASISRSRRSSSRIISAMPFSR